MVTVWEYGTRLAADHWWPRHAFSTDHQCHHRLSYWRKRLMMKHNIILAGYGWSPRYWITDVQMPQNASKLISVISPFKLRYESFKLLFHNSFLEWHLPKSGLVALSYHRFNFDRSRKRLWNWFTQTELPVSKCLNKRQNQHIFSQNVSDVTPPGPRCWDRPTYI